MSGETEESVSAWTVDSSHQLFLMLRTVDERHAAELRRADARFAAERDRRYQDRYEAQKEATDHALVEVKEWRQNANEWRGTLTDVIARLPTNDQLTQVVSELRKEQQRLAEEQQRQREGQERSAGASGEAKDSRAISRGTLTIIVAIAAVLSSVFFGAAGIAVAFILRTS